MAENNLLSTGAEGHNTSVSPSGATISAASDPKILPAPSASPSLSTATTSLLTLPIPEHVSNFDTVLQPLPYASLHGSKHNPDFLVRNYAKFIKMSTIVSDFHSLLQTARRSKDQSAFDCLHARVSKAGEDLGSLAQIPLVVKANVDPRLKDNALGRIIPPDMENDWYMVEHDNLNGDEVERDASATKRLQCARKAYEAALDEVSSDSESDGGAYIFEDQQSESEDKILVEDSFDDFPPLHASLSLTVDGLHAQAAPNLRATHYPAYPRPEILQRAADLLYATQRGKNAIMNEYGISLADLDLDVSEDRTLASEVVEDLRIESFRSMVELVETLRRGHEAIMAAHSLPIGGLEVDFDKREDAVEEQGNHQQVSC